MHRQGPVGEKVPPPPGALAKQVGPGAVPARGVGRGWAGQAGGWGTGGGCSWGSGGTAWLVEHMGSGRTCPTFLTAPATPPDCTSLPFLLSFHPMF